ncbi:MAG: hypothetical protein ACI4MC_05000 [Candidatus Coproplasma sp.]
MKTKSKLLPIISVALCSVMVGAFSFAGCGTKETPPQPDPNPIVDPNPDPGPADSIVDKLPVVTAGEDDSKWNYIKTPTSEMSAAAVNGNLTGNYTYNASRLNPLGVMQAATIGVELKADGTVVVGFQAMTDPDQFNGTYKVYTDEDGVKYAIVSGLTGPIRNNPDGKETGYPNEGANTYYWIDDEGNCIFVLLNDTACAPLVDLDAPVLTIKQTLPVVTAGEDDSKWAYVKTPTTEMSAAAVNGNLTGNYTYNASRLNPLGVMQAATIGVELKADGTVVVGFQAMTDPDQFNGTYKVYTDEDGVKYAIVSGLTGPIRNNPDGKETGYPNEGANTYYWIDDEGNCIFVLLSDTSCAPLVDLNGGSAPSDPSDPSDPGSEEPETVVPDNDVEYIYTAPAEWTTADGNISGTYTYAGVKYNGMQDTWSNATVTVTLTDDGKVNVSINDGGPKSNSYDGTYEVYTDNGVQYAIVTGLLGEDLKPGQVAGEGEMKSPNDGETISYYWIDATGNCIFVLNADNTCAPYVKDNSPVPDSTVNYVYTAPSGWTLTDGNISGTYTYAGVKYNGMQDTWSNATVTVTLTDDGKVNVSINDGGPKSNSYDGTYEVYTDNGVQYAIVTGLLGEDLKPGQVAGEGEMKSPNDGQTISYYWIDSTGNCILVLNADNTCSPLVQN